MSSFRDKLERLHESRRRARDRGDRRDLSGVFHADSVEEDDAPPDAPSASDETSTSEPDRESYRVVRADYEPPARHAGTPLASLEDAPVRPLVASFLPDDSPARSELSLERILFVDTETTGLGEDDYAFCIGWGWLDGSAFCLRHGLLDNPEAESELLQSVLPRLRSADLVCTYNGANFDIPLLARRASEHELDADLDALPHLDLLPIARSVAPGLDSHRLEDIERHLLEFAREDDLPGAEVPRTWETYLQQRDPEILQPVLRHNRLDIASLCAALRVLAERDTNEESTERNTSSRESGENEVEQRLARSFRMRSQPDADTDDANSKGSGVSRETTRDSSDESSPEPPSNRAQRSDDSPALPRERARELRRRVDEALAADDWSKAHDMLLELVALHPRHPFALEKLVAWYERAGEPELADHFRSRLRDVSPF